MDSETYWKERGKNKEKMGDKSISSLKAECKRLYEISLKNIQKEIDAFYGRYAGMNGLSIADVQKRLNPNELKSAKIEIADYYNLVNKLAKDNQGKINVDLLRKYKEELRLQSAKAYMSRLEGLKNSLRYNLIDLGFNQEIKFNNELSKLCENIHSYTSFDIDTTLGFSAGYDKIPENKIKYLVNERWLGENYSDRIWKDKNKLLDNINNTFLQGIARGQNSIVIAREIANNYKTSFYNAERLCITESAHITESATMESYKEHGVDEIQFIATLDEHTCPICGSLDGQHYSKKEAITGVNYPPLHPNCRCTTISYFEFDEIDKMFDEAQRVARDENGELYYVPASMTYKEWEQTMQKKSTMSINKVVNMLENEKAEYYLFNDGSDPKDLEILDDYHKFFLPESVRNNFNKIESIKTYNDLKSYLHSNRIELTTDLQKLKDEYANKEISAVKEASQKIAVAIETYKVVFGKDSIHKLKRINLYDNELPNIASYNYNRIGEHDKLAGTIQIRDWNITGRDIFHELAHAYQDSNARKGEDALLFSDRVVKENNIKFKSIYGVLGEAENAEMLAEAISQGFTKNRADGREIIMKIRKIQ